MTEHFLHRCFELFYFYYHSLIRENMFTLRLGSSVGKAASQVGTSSELPRSRRKQILGRCGRHRCRCEPRASRQGCVVIDQRFLLTTWSFILKLLISERFRRTNSSWIEFQNVFKDYWQKEFRSEKISYCSSCIQYSRISTQQVSPFC